MDRISNDFANKLLESVKPRSVFTKKKEIVTEDVESEIVRAGRAVNVAIFAFEEAAKEFVEAVIRELAIPPKIRGKTRTESEGDEAIHFITFNLKSDEDFDDFDITVYSNGDIKVFGIGPNGNQRVGLRKPTALKVATVISKTGWE